jgi:hypothetical protein
MPKDLMADVLKAAKPRGRSAAGKYGNVAHTTPELSGSLRFRRCSRNAAGAALLLFRKQRWQTPSDPLSAKDANRLCKSNARYAAGTTENLSLSFLQIGILELREPNGEQTLNRKRRELPRF